MEAMRPRVVIVGAGFGGLYAARTLAQKPVDVLLIDRNNFHLFTPLMYQVATCGLDPSDIAYPVRTIFRKQTNLRFLLGDVIGINAREKWVEVRTNGSTQQMRYDYLIIAAGSVTNYFNRPELEQFAFGLKDLNDALKLRNHVLRLFERASWTDDEAYREALTTLVVVGGGPTGLETAGALYELYNHVLGREFGNGRQLRARVLLVEASDHLLAPYPESLRQAAREQLESLGIEVILGGVVEAVYEDGVRLRDGRFIASHTLVWAAGVKASPLAEMLDIPLERMGRVPVQPTLEVPGYDGLYVVGDMAHLLSPVGDAYPMIIPVAKQQGVRAAENILLRLAGKEQHPFHYHDRGIMATIGRKRAVAYIYNRIQIRGYFAWLAWLGLHLIWLLGFRNRASVFINWVWNYLTYDRSVRLILDNHRQESAEPELP